MAKPKQQNRGQQGGPGFRFVRGRGGRSNKPNFNSHVTEDNNSRFPAKSSEPSASRGRGGYRNVPSGGRMLDLSKSGNLQNPGIAPTVASTGNVIASVPNGLTSKTSNAFSNAYQTGSANRDGKYFIKAYFGSSSKLKPEEDRVLCPQSLQFVPTKKSFHQGPGRDAPAAVIDSLPTKLSAFQRLPGELRWRIYELVFDVHRVEVLRSRDKNPENNIKRVHYRLYHRQLRPRDSKTHAARSSEGRYTCPPLPIALLITCRSIYRDTLCLFYSRVQFIFNTTRTVMRFLKITNKEAQMAIQHIELNHTMYSEPALLNFRWYKCMSDMAWYNACDDLTVYCKSLRVLHIDMKIGDWPISLQVGERWSLPLLAFARYGPRLDWVDIRLHMGSFKQDQLEKVAREIEEQIMDPTAFQIREDERLARELAGPVKAKVLRLMF
ncbi:hypothetical protein IFM61606_07839 [Aspergillus udagawae]|uniref:DUF7730 domain-containing protein n=1 Tax=Aspergillus udagawae TaxID=91492 RepID=A0ABQ1A893_9EURO|nr:hypothetical protein IFM51744_01563 [Aspergillus udagawae]GFF73536.1 hypothetical protein IFM53868_01092 [Aspergillus udagawae]GFG17569.1 hypothetical protein IFM5058_08544 [Aspergillus udagawae]GFG27782.1 hypothetical protein IFM61606_07839 [Aspergillus udagawae]